MQSRQFYDFENLLKSEHINYLTNFKLNDFTYDFKIGNILVSINSSATNNSTWTLFGTHKGVDSKYHLNKLLNAQENNFKCINIFDWDDTKKILNLITNKETIGARKCTIKEVSKSDAVSFINKIHLQNYAKDSIRIGLYYKEELVSIMTFDKPRYNNNYEYELIRYCSTKNIIGGAEKLFKYFNDKYKPNSIISYCDDSKFSGNVYTKLGFSLLRKGAPSKHWFNCNTKKHVTDNLLRQQGYDRLFKANYGKGENNNTLMIENGFVEIYDCGQSTYVIKKGEN